jgi:hypothetical protein
MAGILRTDTIQNSNTSTIITQTNSTTITIGTTGQTIALASGASSSGFGALGAVNWDTTPKTTTVTAVSGTGYFVNTTSGSVTVNLPAGTAGSIIAVSDYANISATNFITISPNGTDKINGVNSSYYLTTNGAAVTLVYVDATRGWKDINDATLDATGLIAAYVAATGGTITTCGNYKIHTFTGPGTFTVTNAGNFLGSNSVDYLVVAGGGGGGVNGGGGGAGGFRYSNSTFSVPGAPGAPLASSTALPVTATGYPITVGSGGAGAPYGSGGTGITSGSPSVFSTITSTGGGYGGNGTPVPRVASPGGSGGGSRYDSAPSFGSGNTPPVSPSQGNNGGGAPAPESSGGGGGAMAAGSGLGPSQQRQPGGIGAGIPTAFGANGVPSGGYQYYSGGGGGATQSTSPSLTGNGGTGGGANSGIQEGTASSGTTNTGGGGGGGAGGFGISGNGGSGIVVIRYKFQ